MRLYSACKKNEELFFNAFPFENSYYFISGYRLRCGAYSTGNLSIYNSIQFFLSLSVAVTKLQVAILARSSREMSQTVRID